MEANQHDRDRRAPGEMNSSFLAPHEGGHLFFDDLDQLLGRGKARHHLLTDGSGLDGLDEVFDHLKIDIRLQEGNPHLFQSLLDILLRQLSMASEPLKNRSPALW